MHFLESGKVKKKLKVMASAAVAVAAKVPRQRYFWQSVPNQLVFIEGIAKELGIKEVLSPSASHKRRSETQFFLNKWSDWYNVPRQEVLKRGGQGLFLYYSSLAELLPKLYPAHPWDATKFVQSTIKPPGHWTKRENLFKLIDEAEVKLGITKVQLNWLKSLINAYRQPEDWYTVTLADLKMMGLPSVITKIKLADLLSEKYPDHTWDKVYLLKGRYAQQRRLEKAITGLFPVGIFL